MASKPGFTCACCGRLTQVDPYGSYEICPVCFWQDDPVQLADPEYAPGANRISLALAQSTYLQTGASELRCVEFVRPARSEEKVDPVWRIYDASQDERSDRAPLPLTPYWLKN